MNKVKKLLRFIILIVKKPSLINLILDSDQVWEKYLKKHHKDTVHLPVIKINDLIPDFNETLNTFTYLGGGSLPTDIMLLKALARQIKNCSYFEIGTWRGESVINIAETAKECYTLNLSKEEIIASGMTDKYANLHEFFSKGKENIHHLYGNSLHYDFDALNKKFDLIFIDGNHKYDFVKNDTEKVFKHLVKENSIVVWHDYAYNPEMPRAEVLSGILDGIPEHFKGNIYHVSNTMCAIYINKKLNTSAFEYNKTPDKVFVVNLKSTSIF